MGKMPEKIASGTDAQPAEALGAPFSDPLEKLNWGIQPDGTGPAVIVISEMPGISPKVLEFARRGGGTPYPWDPPDRLVTSGPYAYVRNPMQLSTTLIMLLAGAV